MFKEKGEGHFDSIYAVKHLEEKKKEEKKKRREKKEDRITENITKLHDICNRISI